jgi:hypothetical protein
MPSPAELQALLQEPNESLSIEHKSWLEFSDRRSKAILAKAAIALANHGGGIIVLGMCAEEDAGPLRSQARPDYIERYTQDDINAYINSFADPEIHCELLFAPHPTTGVEHAFIIVPGGMSVPVMCTNTCESVITAHRCYIRKPGPRSQEPHDAQEWRALLERCLRAGREGMLDAIRAIVQGSAGSEPEVRVASVVAKARPSGRKLGNAVAESDTLLALLDEPAFAVADEQPLPPAKSELTQFIKKALIRWHGLIAQLPDDDAARFPHGHYELGFEIFAGQPLPNLTELRAAMRQAGSIKHTGRGPFVQLSRPEFVPMPVEGTLEVWLGKPAETVGRRDTAHCDFWRADVSGHLILVRGYDEDALPNREPGGWMDVTLPVWRVGEAILYVGRLAEIFGSELSFLVRCRYTGLQNRILTRIDNRGCMFDDHRCADSEVTVGRLITVAQARDNLVEVLRPLLAPLYERFSFFDLPEKLVRQEVGRLTQGRF